MATLTEMASEIVMAHASLTSMTTEELLKEIKLVYETLKQLEAGVTAQAAQEEKKPELSAKQSIKANEVICLICGKGGMKTLARHLNQVHNITPREYKKQFDIPSKQPLAAKKFSESRKKLAEERGLADNLAKARQIRMANIEAKKVVKAKPTKAKAK